MRQSNRDQDHHGGATHKRGGKSHRGSGYRGSYYGSDGHDGTPISHRGRGPKGYVRSDERLKELICEYLIDDPNIDASDVTVEVEQQMVRLTGNIEDREARHEVEALVERIGGVKGVDNQLQTKPVPPPPFLRDYGLTMIDGSIVMLQDEAGAANCDDK